MKSNLLCVRGNCDIEVDEMVLDFPILADYTCLYMGQKVIYATYGHQYHPQNLSPLKKGDVLLNGHTHIPDCQIYEDYIYMNTGSVSIPKAGSRHSYMIMEKGQILWKEMEDGTVRIERNIE